MVRSSIWERPYYNQLIYNRERGVRRRSQDGLNEANASFICVFLFVDPLGQVLYESDMPSSHGRAYKGQGDAFTPIPQQTESSYPGKKC